MRQEQSRGVYAPGAVGISQLHCMASLETFGLSQLISLPKHWAWLLQPAGVKESVFNSIVFAPMSKDLRGEMRERYMLASSH